MLDRLSGRSSRRRAVGRRTIRRPRLTSHVHTQNDRRDTPKPWEFGVAHTLAVNNEAVAFDVI